MPKIAALGGLSSRGFGEFAQQTAANYIEDVFSTYLYTGNGSTQTITNGIDLAGKGGLVWIKGRGGVSDHILQNNLTQYLSSNITNAASDPTAVYVTAFNASGFSLGFGDAVNKATSPGPYASWTFRKQSKFFDVVTYTGNGTPNRSISHNLKSTPGMIIIKCTSSNSTTWAVYHRSLGVGNYMQLEATNGVQAVDIVSAVSSTTFTLGDAYLDNNGNGNSYVAYLFAHNAGGFGADGSQNVISCGGYTGNGGTQAITLGYEPQYILIKKASGSPNEGWWIYDTMRGMSLTDDAYLLANTSAAESTVGSSILSPTATGFNITSSASAINQSSSTYIYMAIRRGPMRTPTDATKVFKPVVGSGNGSTDTGFPVDMLFLRGKAGGGANLAFDRLRGGTLALFTTSTSGDNTGFYVYFDSNSGADNQTYVPSPLSHNFRRAPGFFDVVCYTGTGVARTVSHNLGVAPELIIIKSRSAARNWCVGFRNSSNGRYDTTLILNLTNGEVSQEGPWFGSAAGSATYFPLGTDLDTNGSGQTYVAYLFATCAGVSKVGSYTGTGATQTIDCGFTGGARFVMIKRTDSTGDWWVWDTARGMVAGTDPRLAYNSTAAETNANWVYTTTGGFQIVTSDATVNASGGTYIYLAIA